MITSATAAIKRALRRAAFYTIALPVFCLVSLAALVMGDPTEH